MEIRNAKISDADDIYTLISSYAQLDRMLFRSMADIYENILTFIVAEEKGRIVGCCSLQVIWKDLAELKSLAVNSDHQKKGVGKKMINKAVDLAAQLQIPQIFALTLEPGFFNSLGFEIVTKDTLPMKVWSDCANCPKQDNCDEIAMIKSL